jgi:hypothetical protein
MNFILFIYIIINIISVSLFCNYINTKSYYEKKEQETRTRCRGLYEKY